MSSATWELFPLLRHLHYVHLFQTGLASGHAPALLPDRSSLRACAYTDSIVAMRWRARDITFVIGRLRHNARTSLDIVEAQYNVLSRPTASNLRSMSSHERTLSLNVTSSDLVVLATAEAAVVVPRCDPWPY